MKKPFFKTISRKALDKILATRGLSIVFGTTDNGVPAWKLADSVGNEVGLAAGIDGRKIVSVSWPTIWSLARDLCVYSDSFAFFSSRSRLECTFTENPFKGVQSSHEMKVTGDLG